MRCYISSLIPRLTPCPAWKLSGSQESKSLAIWSIAVCPIGKFICIIAFDIGFLMSSELTSKAGLGEISEQGIAGGAPSSTPPYINCRYSWLPVSTSTHFAAQTSFHLTQLQMKSVETVTTTQALKMYILQNVFCSSFGNRAAVSNCFAHCHVCVSSCWLLASTSCASVFNRTFRYPSTNFSLQLAAMGRWLHYPMQFLRPLAAGYNREVILLYRWMIWLH